MPIAAGIAAYPVIFLGLVASGDIFLVATIYSARLGLVSLPLIFVLAVCASMVSDAMWYMTGRFASLERLRRFGPLWRSPALVEKLTRAFERHSMKLLFACKFLYGTRIITQVLCGAHRMKYGRYFLVNLAGTLLWVSFLMGLITTIDTSLSSFKGILTKVEISATIVLVLLIALRFAIRAFVEEKIIEKD